MTQQIVISRAWCDEHFDRCLQAHDTATGRTRHIESYTDESVRLKLLGYVYTGHRAGQYTYSRRKSQPLTLPLDWQMQIQLADQRETVDANQDW